MYTQYTCTFVPNTYAHVYQTHMHMSVDISVQQKCGVWFSTQVIETACVYVQIALLQIFPSHSTICIHIHVHVCAHMHTYPTSLCSSLAFSKSFNCLYTRPKLSFVAATSRELGPNFASLIERAVSRYLKEDSVSPRFMVTTPRLSCAHVYLFYLKIQFVVFFLGFFLVNVLVAMMMGQVPRFHHCNMVEKHGWIFCSLDALE
jgi:hypothetical protein